MGAQDRAAPGIKTTGVACYSRTPVGCMGRPVSVRFKRPSKQLLRRRRNKLKRRLRKVVKHRRKKPRPRTSFTAGEVKAEQALLLGEPDFLEEMRSLQQNIMKLEPEFLVARATTNRLETGSLHAADPGFRFQISRAEALRLDPHEVAGAVLRGESWKKLEYGADEPLQIGGVSAETEELKHQDSSTVAGGELATIPIESIPSDLIKAALDNANPLHKYNFSLRVSGFHGNTDLAFQVFNHMVEAGVQPDHDSFLMMMKGCSKARDVEAASRVHDLMRSTIGEDGTSLPVLTSYLHCLMRVGNLHDAKMLFDNALSDAKLRWELDAPFFNVMISGYLLNKRYAKAWHVYNVMQQDVGCAPNRVTLNIMTNLCAAQGKPEQAQTYLGIMEKRGIIPDKFALNALMKAWARVHPSPAGAVYTTTRTADDIVRRVIDTYGILLSYGYTADRFTFNSLLRVFSNTGRPAGALQVFARMALAGIEPDRLACQYLIMSYANRITVGYFEHRRKRNLRKKEKDRYTKLALYGDRVDGYISELNQTPLSGDFYSEHVDGFSRVRLPAHSKQTAGPDVEDFLVVLEDGNTSATELLALGDGADGEAVPEMLEDGSNTPGLSLIPQNSEGSEERGIDLAIERGEIDFKYFFEDVMPGMDPFLLAIDEESTESVDCLSLLGPEQAHILDLAESLSDGSELVPMEEIISDDYADVDKETCIESASQVLRWMDEVGISPATSTLNCLLSVHARALRLNRAVGLLESQFSARKLEPDSRTFTIILRMYANAKRLHPALELFEKITNRKEGSLKATYGMYSALLLAAIKSRDFQCAVSLVKRMRSEGFKLRDSDTKELRKQIAAAPGDFRAKEEVAFAIFGDDFRHRMQESNPSLAHQIRAGSRKAKRNTRKNVGERRV